MWDLLLHSPLDTGPQPGVRGTGSPRGASQQELTARHPEPCPPPALPQPPLTDPPPDPQHQREQSPARQPPSSLTAHRPGSAAVGTRPPALQRHQDPLNRTWNPRRPRISGPGEQRVPCTQLYPSGGGDRRRSGQMGSAARFPVRACPTHTGADPAPQRPSREPFLLRVLLLATGVPGGSPVGVRPVPVLILRFCASVTQM